MGNEQIQIILTRLDNLERQNEQIAELMTSITGHLENFQEVQIKNGGGRIVTYQRGEFFQMLYDRPKENFNSLTDNAKRFNNVLDVVWKFATVIALFVAILTR